MIWDDARGNVDAVIDVTIRPTWVSNHYSVDNAAATLRDDNDLY